MHKYMYFKYGFVDKCPEYPPNPVLNEKQNEE